MTPTRRAALPYLGEVDCTQSMVIDAQQELGRSDIEVRMVGSQDTVIDAY